MDESVWPGPPPGVSRLVLPVDMLIAGPPLAVLVVNVGSCEFVGVSCALLIVEAVGAEGCIALGRPAVGVAVAVVCERPLPGLPALPVGEIDVDELCPMFPLDVPSAVLAMEVLTIDPALTVFVVVDENIWELSKVLCAPFVADVDGAGVVTLLVGTNVAVDVA